MSRFSANISMLFTEVDFLDRFEKAALAGFKAVEYQFPYAWEADLLAEKAAAYGLQTVLHNFPPGDWDAGERGIALIPGRQEDFKESVRVALHYAKTTACPCLNCLAGLKANDISEADMRQTLVANLRYAADALGRENIRLLIEPLNAHDVPGFYLNRSAPALALIETIDHPNIWLQYDIYHMQIMEGNLAQTIQKNLPRIAHIQLADNPGRHEPGTGEINFANLFTFIDQAGYEGWIGCEYKPAGRTEDGLGWLKPYL
jgi:hydroxypyruvate isomerase